MIRATTDSSGDWKDLYRLLVTSLRASSVHFQQLSVETATVGLWGLTQAHSKAEGCRLEGQQIGPADRSVLTEWVAWADVLLRAFDATSTTPAALAASLGVPEACVLHFQPVSQPLLPAHALVADSSRQQLLLLVRGTSGWHDCLTDLVAHTAPLGQGQVHSGMLDCARAILQQCMPAMQQHLQQHPGYRIHCLGHSLGGGVAALAAYLLRNDAELRQHVQTASGVMATGFGTPPVMTRDLAESVSQYTRTLVHADDLVPCTCVASLAVLQAELEQQKEAVFGSSALLGRLRDSGVLDKGLGAIGALCSTAVANRMTAGVAAAAVSKSPAMQRWVSAGLQVGAGLLVSKAKQMHEEALAGNSSTAATTTSSSNSSSSSSSSIVHAAAAKTAAPGMGGGGASNAGSAAGPTSSAGSGSAGMFGFAAMRQAVAAVSAAATAAAATSTGGTAPTSSAGVQQQEQPHSQQQQQQPAGAGATNAQQKSTEQAAAATAERLRYEEEEQAAKVQLFCPGQIWHLARIDEAAGGPDSTAAVTAGLSGGGGSYKLTRASANCTGRFGGRLLVKRRMLRDHFLTEHMQALLQLQAQLVQQAALHC